MSDEKRTDYVVHIETTIFETVVVTNAIDENHAHQVGEELADPLGINVDRETSVVKVIKVDDPERLEREKKAANNVEDVSDEIYED